ncbi:gap junction delta-4 protein [Cynocephalus volans]|uniref:gap junction delta-4 protein n=1 Tax=Cynocephalus volans TaxID=110931 RepID=UPI002FC80947
MEGLDLLGFLIITLNCNVTMVGKIWLIFMVLLRVVAVVLAGYPVYQDEQERFVCNTLQPGCANVCYDIFSPVSLLRFWLIQSVSVLLPDAVFSVYVLHQGAVLAALGPRRSHGGPVLSAAEGRCPGRCQLSVPDFSCGYIAHLSLRILLEAAFGALHYLLFGFLVPKTFSCTQSPCTSVVDCYVSRPTEKSILTLFIWAVGALSLLLSVADLICSVRRRTSGGRGPRRGAKGSRSLGRSRMHEDGEWEAEAMPTHPGMWAAGDGAHGPGGKSGALGRMELPDEGDSEGMSSASEKLARTPKGARDRSPRKVAQDPRSKGPARSEEQPSAPGSRLAGHSSCGQLQPPARLASSGSAPHLRAKKSEWV